MLNRVCGLLTLYCICCCLLLFNKVSSLEKQSRRLSSPIHRGVSKFILHETASDGPSTSPPQNTIKTVDYPVKIKQVVSRMTEATQRILKTQAPRIEIELPPGVNFGVETLSSSAKSSESKSDLVKRSNREAARLITEMFNVISSSTVVLFPSEDEAFKARNIWGKAFTGAVLSIDTPEAKGYGKLRSRRFSAQEQEQALLGSDGVYIPNGTNLLVICGPRAKDMKKIRNIHERTGEETLIILLNARIGSYSSMKSDVKISDLLPSDANELESWFGQTFSNAFNYAPPISKNDAVTSRELLLYHEYGKEWSLAEQSVNNIFGLNIGNSPKLTTLWTGSSKPSETDIIEIVKKNVKSN